MEENKDFYKELRRLKQFLFTDQELKFETRFIESLKVVLD